MPYFELRYSDGELLATLGYHYFKNLTLLNKDGTDLPIRDGEAATTIAVETLGSGHFGIVVRAKDELGLQRAVKFIDMSRFPRPERSGYLSHRDTSGAELVRDLSQEIRTTNLRLFKHIVPVVGCDAVRDRNGHLVPFTVSPFVDGAILSQYFEGMLETALRRKRSVDLNALHDLFLDITDDLLGALIEMEEGAVSHIDLKPSNIMVQRAGVDHAYVRDQAFIIDFAGAISHRPQPLGTRVPLMMTPFFFPADDIAVECVRDHEGKASHHALAKWGHVIDRHCLGRTLESIVVDLAKAAHIGNEAMRHQEARKEKQWRLVLNDDFDVVAGLINRLKHKTPDTFTSAPEARAAFQAIARHQSSNVLVSRALTDRTRGIVINVGVRSVKIAPPFDRITNHPVMQRLRKLQQLTLISDVFPAATHTRFTHVLSTFGLAKEYLMALNRDTEFRLLCSHKDVEQILAASLLHDLGQYAFSHTLEDLKKLGDLLHIGPLQKIRHDQELVRDYIDKPDDSTDGTTIRSILEDAGLNVEHVLYMIDKTAKSPAYGPACSVGRDIVSGVIDADRISYLIQDSRTSGTSFGEAINIDQLVESLCVRHEGSDVSLGIREAGVSAVEAALAAVYWMYRNVYWHPLNRGMMAAVKHVFWDLLEHGGMTFEDYERTVYGRTERFALRHLSDMYDALLDKHVTWYNPIANVAKGRRSSVLRVWSVGGVSPDAKNKPAEDLYRGVYRSLSREFFKTAIRNIAESLPASMSPRRGEILLDVPMKKRIVESLQAAATVNQETETERGRREPLYVKLKSRHTGVRWVLLEDHTPLVRALSNAEDLSARKVRVFFSRDLLQRCAKAGVDDLWSVVNSSMRHTLFPIERPS